MLNIVIPMAGRGSRFADAGYELPKPLIDVHGETMIRRVVNNLVCWRACRFIFICRQDFLDAYGPFFTDHFPDISKEIVTVPKVTAGAACTVLAAQDLIDTEDELVIANSDQLVLDQDFFSQALAHFGHSQADGGMPCFLNDDPKWSYIHYEKGRVREVVEKQVVSPIATVGIYWYRKGSFFVAAAKDMIHKDRRVNGEFYVAPTYNEMIACGMKVVPYMVNQMVGLGTPEDLESFNRADS